MSVARRGRRSKSRRVRSTATKADARKISRTIPTSAAEAGSAANVWTELLAQVEKKVNRHSFYTWFKPTSFLADSGGAITVLVPNLLFRDWLTKHYSPVLSEALREVKRADAAIVFVSDAASPEIHTRVEEPAAAATPIVTPQLNGRYTFDTFIEGPSNEFARAACLSVARLPGRSYNPLFVYGGVGLGKTHLLHAIGHHLHENFPKLSVNYVSSERFLNDMVNAVRYDRILDFRERYRSVDVLLVDDIQFLAGKEGTQMEFFHTFNALHDSQKQIVISSDCPPHEIPLLEERLRSRFEWGLIADIQPPNLETKLAILKRKAEVEAVQLPDDVAMYIAGRIKANIRELEGSLIRLIAYADLTRREISLDLAQDVLRDVIEGEKRVTIESIQRYVAEYYQLKVSDLRSRVSSKSVLLPRQIAMYLCKSLTHASLPEIGRSFGGKHHSTVIQSVNKIETLRRRDRDFDLLLTSFREAFI